MSANTHPFLNHFAQGKIILQVVLFAVSFQALSVPLQQPAVDFTNTKFLSKPTAVRDALYAHGFVPVTFTTHDKYQLQGLFLSRANAKGTIIFCPAFSTNKEISAIFFSMVPDTYNILFFDCRGQGMSDGASIMFHPFSYMQNTVHDVVAALNFIQHKTDGLPIIVHGTCWGAFHATQALLLLQNKQQLAQYNVKGIIFDSGWGSAAEAAQSAPSGMLSKKLTKYFKRIFTKSTTDIQHMLLYKMMHGIGSKSARLCAFFLLRPTYARFDKTCNLFDQIGQLPVPIFYIHSKDDNFVRFARVKKLYNDTTSYKKCWWIEPGRSYHAEHAYKLTTEYRQQLTDFLNHVVP